MYSRTFQRPLGRAHCDTFLAPMQVSSAAERPSFWALENPKIAKSAFPPRRSLPVHSDPDTSPLTAAAETVAARSGAETVSARPAENALFAIFGNITEYPTPDTAASGTPLGRGGELKIKN